MATQANGFREQILIVTFVAMQKQHEEHFFDTTIEQASKFIWKNICPTAVILYADEYVIETHKAIVVKKKKLDDNELAYLTKQ